MSIPMGRRTNISWRRQEPSYGAVRRSRLNVPGGTGSSRKAMPEVHGSEPDTCRTSCIPWNGPFRRPSGRRGPYVRRCERDEAHTGSVAVLRRSRRGIDLSFDVNKI